MTEGFWRRVAATPLAICLERSSAAAAATARAVYPVERSRSSAVAYGEPGSNAMVRERIYVLALRECSPIVAELRGTGHAVRPPAIRRCQNC